MAKKIPFKVHTSRWECVDWLINIDADTEEDLPQSVSGSFWAEKKEDGWHGLFQLDNGEKWDRRDDFIPDLTAPYVITAAVHRPERKILQRPATMAEAEHILWWLKPVEYDLVERFEARIEDCLDTTETHCWEF